MHGKEQFFRAPKSTPCKNRPNLFTHKHQQHVYNISASTQFHFTAVLSVSGTTYMSTSRIPKFPGSKNYDTILSQAPTFPTAQKIIVFDQNWPFWSTGKNPWKEVYSSVWSNNFLFSSLICSRYSILGTINGNCFFLEKGLFQPLKVK